MLPPVQIIAVDGTWWTNTGESLSLECEEAYYLVFREIVFEVK